MEGGDIRGLERELERREMANADHGITKIVRVIVDPGCEKCGHKPDVQPLGGASRPLHSVRSGGTPGNGVDE